MTIITYFQQINEINTTYNNKNTTKQLVIQLDNSNFFEQNIPRVSVKEEALKFDLLFVSTENINCFT